MSDEPQEAWRRLAKKREGGEPDPRSREERRAAFEREHARANASYFRSVRDARALREKEVAAMTWGALGRRAAVRAVVTATLVAVVAFALFAVQNRLDFGKEAQERALLAVCLGALAGPAALVELLQARHPREERRDIPAALVVFVVVAVVGFYAVLQAAWAQQLCFQGMNRGAATDETIRVTLPRLLYSLPGFFVVLAAPAVPFAALAWARLARGGLFVETLVTGIGAAVVLPMIGTEYEYSATIGRHYDWIWSESIAETRTALGAFALVLPLAAALGEQLDRKHFPPEPEA